MIHKNHLNNNNSVFLLVYNKLKKQKDDRWKNSSKLPGYF